MPAEPAPRCVYCGARTTGGLACPSHRDLLARDPTLSDARRPDLGRDLPAPDSDEQPPPRGRQRRR